MRQNEGLSLAFNAIAIALAIGGVLNPLTAMFAVFVTGGLLMANSSRSLLDGTGDDSGPSIA